MEISQKFVAFSEYMNFNTVLCLLRNLMYQTLSIFRGFASHILLKFIYSEKATKFCEISTLLLSYVVPVKSKVDISQNFVASSEYMNFKNCMKNLLEK